MVSDKNLFLLTGESSFEEILYSACERLEEKRIQFSIRRIREMDNVLTALEQEIEEFISKKTNHG